MSNGWRIDKFAPPDYQWRREPNCTYWRLKSAQNDGWRFSKGRREAPEICPLQNQFSAKPWCCLLKNMWENLAWLSLYQLKWLCILQWVKSGRTWLPHIYWEKWEKQIIWRIYSIKFSQRTPNLQQRFQEMREKLKIFQVNICEKCQISLLIFGLNIFQSPIL